MSEKKKEDDGSVIPLFILMLIAIMLAGKGGDTVSFDRVTVMFEDATQRLLGGLWILMGLLVLNLIRMLRRDGFKFGPSTKTAMFFVGYFGIPTTVVQILSFL